MPAAVTWHGSFACRDGSAIAEQLPVTLEGFVLWSVAREKSGQYLRDLPGIRADIADREAIVRITRTPA